LESETAKSLLERKSKAGRTGGGISPLFCPLKVARLTRQATDGLDKWLLQFCLRAKRAETKLRARLR